MKPSSLSNGRSFVRDSESYPATWPQDLRATPDYAGDRDLLDGCFARQRRYADDAVGREKARAILNDFHAGWDVRLKAAWAIWRGATRYDAIRAAVFQQARRYVERYFPQVYQAQLRARHGDGLAGNFQFSRLWEIAQLVRRYDVSTCLELGSGASSAMFAQLLGGREQFTTVEEFPEWRDRLPEILGDLYSRCTSLLAASVFETVDGTPTIRYEMDHARPYDMVYVDGPSNAWKRFPEHREAAHRLDPHAGQLPCCDVARMWELGNYPRLVVFDGRRSTIRYLLERADHRYELLLCSQYHAICFGTMPPAYRYHSLLVRRDALTR